MMTEAIADILAKGDPAIEATYMANTRGALGKLDELTGQITLKLIPARNTPFIVFRDGCYRYIEDRFGLNAVGSADRSPGARRIRELRAKMGQLGVVCVFDEPRFDRCIVNVIPEGTQARAGTIDLLGAAIEDGPERHFVLPAPWPLHSGIASNRRDRPAVAAPAARFPVRRMISMAHGIPSHRLASGTPCRAGDSTGNPGPGTHVGCAGLDKPDTRFPTREGEAGRARERPQAPLVRR